MPCLKGTHLIPLPFTTAGSANTAESASLRTAVTAIAVQRRRRRSPRPAHDRVGSSTPGDLSFTDSEHRTILAWAAKLKGKEWTIFGTFTFRRPIPARHAVSAVRLWTSWLRRMSGTGGEASCRCALWSAEAHVNGNVHIHALLEFTPSAYWTHCEECAASFHPKGPFWRVMKESWYFHRGIARCTPYNPALCFGAERYVVKYVLKENCLDWGVEKC